MDIERSDSMPDGWRLWLDWQEVIAPDNKIEMAALREDSGKSLTYQRNIARRRANIDLSDPVESVTTEYTERRLLRR